MQQRYIFIWISNGGGEEEGNTQACERREQMEEKETRQKRGKEMEVAFKYTCIFRMCVWKRGWKVTQKEKERVKHQPLTVLQQLWLHAVFLAAVLKSVTLTRTRPTQAAIFTRPPSQWLRQNGLISNNHRIHSEYWGNTLWTKAGNERRENDWGGDEKKSKRTEEAEGEEGEEGRAGGRQCLKREREA